MRALRRIRGLTREALAERSDLHVDTIHRLELGEFSPSTTTLAKVARGLGVGRAFLVESDGPPGDEIELLMAVLRGKPPVVVRLAIRAALAIVNECEAMESDDDPE